MQEFINSLLTKNCNKIGFQVFEKFFIKWIFFKMDEIYLNWKKRFKKIRQKKTNKG